MGKIKITDYGRAGVPPSYDGPVWTTDELLRDFKVIQFMAPYALVERKSDSARGVVEFIHSPRLYFDFRPA